MELLMPFSPNSVPLTPITFLERAATAYSDCPSLVYNNTFSQTWDETHRRCVQAASSIKSLGVKRGDVVSVLAPNVPAMYELQFSVPMAGAVLNNINTRLDSRTLSILLRHSESKLVFVDHHLHPLLLQAMSHIPPGTPLPLVILIKDSDCVYDEINVDLHSSNGKKVNLSNKYIIGNYKELVGSGDPRFDWVPPKNEWDPIALVLTEARKQTNYNNKQ